MQHVAIDLGLRESQVCVRDEQGQIIDEKRMPTLRLQKYLTKRPQSRVIVETSAEAFCIADAALALGHEVRVVPATLVRALGVGERGIKTDQRDARKLSEVSTRVDLPSVHVPSQLSRERKALCNSRKALIKVRTLLRNHARGHLRKQALALPAHSKNFAVRMRESLLSSPEGMPSHIEWILTSIEHVEQELGHADEALQQIADNDPLCQRLMSIPGVGPLIAVRFVAVVDKVSRFHSAHELMSYVGLTPGEDSSASRKRRTGITKAGACDLRFALVQGAWSLLRSKRNDPLHVWARSIRDRRNARIAVVAVARKLVGLLFALWRDGSSYDASQAARPVSQPT
jgi:transposase